MTVLPETRDSLLVRLRDASDAAAWDEFAEIYRPMVVRIGLRSGLQPTDAEDLAQRVLVSVSRAIGDWRRDDSRGGFRSWLRTVARNAVVNMFHRGPKDAAVGGSEFLDLCQKLPAATDEIERLIDEEYRRSLFRAAAERVEREVQPTTWQSFWRTTMQEESPKKVADELGFSIGKVYGARSRVMKLLQRAVGELDDDIQARSASE